MNAIEKKLLSELRNTIKNLSDSKENLIEIFKTMSEGSKLLPDDEIWFNRLRAAAVKLSKFDFFRILKTMEKGMFPSDKERDQLEALLVECAECCDYVARRKSFQKILWKESEQTPPGITHMVSN